MKQLRIKLDRYLIRLEQKWQALPHRDQCRYTLYIFAAYGLLTAGVVLSVWYESAKHRKEILIDHIENPVLKKNDFLQISTDNKARFDKRDSARQNKQ